MFVDKKIITFEIPTHFLTKSALKLEALLKDLQIAGFESHPIIHHHALNSCMEVLNMTCKPELKSRFLKEILRIKHTLDKSGVCINSDLHTALSRHILHLSTQAGSFAGKLANDPFIQTIRSTYSYNAQEMEPRSPKLLLWLQSSAEQRHQAFKSWIDELAPLQDLIQTYLTLLRTMVLFDDISIHQGFYQCTLPSANACQLVLVRLSENEQIIPQVQLGHHRLTLTLQKAFSMEKVKHAPDVVELGLCQL